MCGCQSSATGPAEAARWQAVLDAGYEEDMSISNTKIGSCVSRQPGAQPGSQCTALATGLGLLTCATALLAQFYPKPFPENYWLLVACVVVYFLLNTALQVRHALRQPCRGVSRS